MRLSFKYRKLIRRAEENLKSEQTSKAAQKCLLLRAQTLRLFSTSMLVKELLKREFMKRSEVGLELRDIVICGSSLQGGVMRGSRMMCLAIRLRKFMRGIDVASALSGMHDSALHFVISIDNAVRKLKQLVN